MFSFRKAIGLVALSAILIALSFVPYNLYLLGFIGFLPLFFVFENFTPNKKQIFFLWLVWVLILNFIAYHWIMHTIAVYGMMPTAVAFPLFLLYTLGTSGKMLLFFIFLNHIQKKSPLFSGTYTTLFAIVVAFGLAELVG
ncbi:MAG TPA: hypothetical protein PLY93_14785, partial [Turneriella sp.]|nr:hypothetical protein [Turneriella sp.]